MFQMAKNRDCCIVAIPFCIIIFLCSHLIFRKTMASAGASNRRQKYFKENSEGYKFLAGAFKEFDSTGGKSGIDSSISSKSEIDSIYRKYSIFHEYSERSFPDNFRNLASKYKLSKYKDRKRVDLPSKFFVLFYYYISFSSSFTYKPPNSKSCIEQSR